MHAEHIPNSDSSAKSWRYALFNLLLLALLAGWLWQQNLPVALPEAAMPAGGKLQCVSYSPYYGPQQTPLIASTHISHEQIDRDLALLAQRFDCVRIYSVSQGLDHVPEAAQKLGLKVLLGAWIGWVKADNDKELELAISLANRYAGTVSGLIVGNEVLLRGEQTEAAMRSYIEHAKQHTKVPVTYADVWEFWLQHKALQDSVDFVTVHILPYWENDPQSIDHAIRHAEIVMQKLGENFAKPILIGESGWPSIGRQRQQSLPSQLNQASYLRQFVSLAASKGWHYNLIEAFDQPWKRQLEGAVGGYWGLYSSDRLPKFSFDGPVSERHDGWRPLAWAGAGLLLFLAVLWRKQNRSMPSLLAIASLGSLAGLSAYLQAGYLLTACRNPLEWYSLGFVTIAGILSLLCLPALWHGARSAVALRGLRLCLFTLLLGGAIGGYLLATDGRYRDFPLPLYALPALQLAFIVWASRMRIVAPYRALFWLVGIAALLAAAYCWWLEPQNLHAALWLAVVLLLCLSAWPHRGLNTTSTR